MIAWIVVAMAVSVLPEGSAKVATVSVDFTAVQREMVAGDSALGRAYKTLLGRLAEDGFSVVGPDRTGDIVVKVRRTSEQNLNVLADTSVGSQSRKVHFGEGAGDQAEFQLVYAALDLARGARDALAAAAPALSKPVGRSRAIGAQVGGAMMWSGSSAGFMANVDAESRLGPLRLTVGLVAHQPVALPSGLHIFEWGALAGARLGTHALVPWLLLEAALGGGVSQQRYRASDASGADDRGASLDLLAMGSLGAAVEIVGGFRLGLSGGTWLTPHAHAHDGADGTTWKGPKARPFVGLRAEYLP